MSDTGNSAKPLLSPLVATGLVIISLVSLIGFFALSAYAPDLRNESDGGAHALSKSALGFAGMRILLDAASVPNAIDRGGTMHASGRPGLVLFTPPAEIPGKHDLEEAIVKAGAAPVLIVLPKWLPVPDPKAYGRVIKIGAYDTGGIAKLLTPLSKHTTIVRASREVAPQLSSANQDFIAVPDGMARVDNLQTVSGDAWVPIVAAKTGGAVIARLRGTSVYVLADPDFMNTHGLNDLPTAAFALALVQRLRSGDGPVDFDVTLDGLGRSPSLLRVAFTPPFLGATLCAILAGLLIAFHGLMRFGSPPPDSAPFARGKEALANNAVAMIRLTRREPRMAPRYAATTRNLVLRALGIRRQFSAQDSDDTIRALEHAGQDSYANLSAEAARIDNRSDLVALARKLYEWRQEILHAR